MTKTLTLRFSGDSQPGRASGAAPFQVMAQASLLALAVVATGCSMVPTDKTAGFQEHFVNRGESAARTPDMRDQAEFLAAHQRWAQKDILGCRRELERLLARNPRHRDARLLMADVLLTSRQPRAALDQVREALKYHAQDANVQYAMGLALDANGRPDAALAYYERAAQAAPGNPGYAISCRTAREAARRRNAAAATGGGAAGVTSAVANLKADAANSKVEPASGAVPAKTGPSDAYLAQGCRALELGSHEQARSFFLKAVERRPGDPEIAVAAAACALKHNDPKLAAEILTPAAERFPDSADVIRGLGIAHLQCGNLPASQRELQRAISLDKSSALAYFSMGCTLAKLGQREAARADFRQAESLDPRYAVRPEEAHAAGL